MLNYYAKVRRNLGADTPRKWEVEIVNHFNRHVKTFEGKTKEVALARAREWLMNELANRNEPIYQWNENEQRFVAKPGLVLE